MSRRHLSVGMCYGFEYRSSLELRSLRSGSGPPLEVVRGAIPSPIDPPLAEWPELIGQRAPAAIYLGGPRSYTVTIGDMGRFLVDLGGRRITAHMAPQLPSSSTEGLLFSTPAAVCVTELGDLALHAASVDVDGKAVLLAATGSGGKTTLAAAFHLAGYRTLGDDLSRCGTNPPIAYPGPALIRLRVDAAETLELTEVEPTTTRAGKVHFLINEDRRGEGAPVGLAAIVFLQWSTDGDFQLEAIEPHEALKRLWPLSFFLPDEERRALCFARLVDLTQATPSFIFRRPRRFELLSDAVRFIAETCVSVRS